ncbi:MAG TPA: helix-turn-helix domain-containing protein [Pirellulales bacterium]|jgi:transposase|nr:helix-turn-helix domain-containing protein [Pirellulales bacterium]
MRPKGKPADLEARRLEAVELLSAGKKASEVAKLVGASASSIKRWKDALRQGGREALRAKRHPGRRPRLTPAQKSELLQLLAAGPRAAGYSTDDWTSPQVRELIERHFNVVFHVGYVWQILRDMGWSNPTGGRRVNGSGSSDALDSSRI